MKKDSSINSKENDASFIHRFYIYQKERFPFVGHGILVGAFSFSAIAYSRISRGVQDFIAWDIFLAGIFLTFTIFFLVRIFDEFKDAEDDALYRKELPVPRGLVSLNELKVVGIIIITLQILTILLVFPKMIFLYFLVMGYLLLMGKEFFISEWLKKRQFWYVTSHMFIIPLVDIFASGLDWFMAGVEAPLGLLFFFAVSYMNGIVLEIGRKIKPKELESLGVLTYSSLLGTERSVYLWQIILIFTFILSILAAHYAGYGLLAALIIGIIFLVCLIPSILFIKNQTLRFAKSIEYSSAIWTITMYLSLGGIPMIQKLLSNG